MQSSYKGRLEACGIQIVDEDQSPRWIDGSQEEHSGIEGEPLPILLEEILRIAEQKVTESDSLLADKRFAAVEFTQVKVSTAFMANLTFGGLSYEIIASTDSDPLYLAIDFESVPLNSIQPGTLKNRINNQLLLPAAYNVVNRTLPEAVQQFKASLDKNPLLAPYGACETRIELADLTEDLQIDASVIHGVESKITRERVLPSGVQLSIGLTTHSYLFGDQLYTYVQDEEFEMTDNSGAKSTGVSGEPFIDNPHYRGSLWALHPATGDLQFIDYNPENLFVAFTYTYKLGEGTPADFAVSRDRQKFDTFAREHGGKGSFPLKADFRTTSDDTATATVYFRDKASHYQRSESLSSMRDRVVLEKVRAIDRFLTGLGNTVAR